MRKIVKLLPAALALMLMSPAVFAAASDEATSTLNITVPEFINITKDNSSVETASATFDDNYTTITVTPALNAVFNVVNNQPDRAIYLSATAPTSGGSTTALYGEDADSMNIVLQTIQDSLLIQLYKILLPDQVQHIKKIQMQ